MAPPKILFVSNLHYTVGLLCCNTQIKHTGYQNIVCKISPQEKKLFNKNHIVVLLNNASLGKGKYCNCT